MREAKQNAHFVPLPSHQNRIITLPGQIQPIDQGPLSRMKNRAGDISRIEAVADNP